jgi:hypothetical protein
MSLRIVKVLYKNMWVDRPKYALFGLIALAFFCTFNICTFNMYNGLTKLGEPVVTGLCVFLSLLLWFVGFPAFVLWIDINNNPKRIERL